MKLRGRLGAAAMYFLLASGMTALGLANCNSNQINGNGNGDGSGNGNGQGDGQSAYCMGQGPPILVSDKSTVGRCSGQVAATVFRYGLCSCSGLSSGSPITIDAFDSTRPAAMTFGTGGSMGVNSNVNVSNRLSVGGSLEVAGALTLNQLVTGVDVLTADTISGEQSIDVGRDASIGGDVKSNGVLKVARNLTYPSSRTLSASNPMIGGQTLRAPVSVPPPCDCAPNQIFDIAGYVEARRNNHDNTAIGLDPARLTNFDGDQTLDFGCGRFFLNRIGGRGKLNFNVTGRTAVFVGGDVNLQDAFSVTLGPSGELDLFINGGLTSSGPLNFGNKNAPARVRLYMGGQRNINLSAGSVFGGNIYAPESALVPSGTLEVFGSVFVSSFNPSAAVNIHHDVAVLKAADSCAPPTSGGTAPGCASCSDCGGQACKGGACTTCAGDGDCCRPLTCQDGKCIIIVG